MTVAELRALLEKHEDDATVLVCDEEGWSSDVAPVLGESDIGEIVYVMLDKAMRIQAAPKRGDT